MPAKKIVINALAYKQNSSGIGVMIRELFSRFVIVTNFRCIVVLSKDSPELSTSGKIENIRSSYDCSQNLRRMLFQSVAFGQTYCRDAVLLTTDSKTPFFLPKSCRLIPVVTDLAVYRMGEVYQRSRTLWWRLQYRYVRHRAVHYVAISEFTKAELTAVLHIPPENISVVPCACGEHFYRVDDPEALAAVRDQYKLPKAYLLFVGNNNPRKNLRRMIEAYDLARRQGGFTHHLVIAGEQGWKFSRDVALQGISHAKDIHFIGFVPDAAMPALYSASALFVFPSLYEGFGIPVLEAQCCGVPVLTAETSALPEVGGDGALYCDPLRAESIAGGICSILTDESRRQDLIQSGYENVKRFSWARSAELLNEIVEKELRV